MGYMHASTCCCPRCCPPPPEPPEPLIEVEPPHVSELYAALAAKDAEIKRLMDCIGLEHHEIETVLGAALGYPWYKDDQKNFPGADESAGVCVGEHTVVSLADEAASKIAKLREELAEARKVIEGLLDGVKGVEEGGCLDHLDCWDDAETRWYTPLEQARAFLARKEAK